MIAPSSRYRRKQLTLGLLVGLALTVAACADRPTASVDPSDPGVVATTLVATPPTTTLTAVPGGSYVRLRNKTSGTYLYEAEGQVKYGSPAATDTQSHWIIDAAERRQRIINRATGHAMAIDNQHAYVQSIALEDSLTSSQWTIEGAVGDGPATIRNVWHNWEVLHIDGRQGYAEHGSVAATSDSAQWLIEAIGADGAALPTASVTPVPTLEPPPTPIPAGMRGATVPWIEYEAEYAATNGTIIGPDRTFGTIPAESSGRRSVALKATGGYVEFTSAQAANSLVVRFVIPDAPKGGGISATLSLYVDGEFRQKLALTSKYAWVYGGETASANNPSVGGAHKFFDEARALVDPIPSGATVRLQKDRDDSAEYYVVDLIDLEQVGPQLSQPANVLSITADCGATADDGSDDGPAIQRCIDRAREHDKWVWIPAGSFDLLSEGRSPLGLEIADVTVQGAGMWYATLRGPWARFHCTGSNCRFADFAILGASVTRTDSSPENAFNGGGGSGSRLENIWVEHTKVGWWVGEGKQNVTSGLIVTSSRFRNLFADGINLCNGTSDSVVENSHFRGTGDDALASWSPAAEGPVNTNNVFRFNTVQLPWRANCFAIYGGAGNTIEDNLCYDVITYPGILIAQEFNSHPFAGVTTVQRNSLIRAGGPMWNQQHGALKIDTAQGPISGLVVRDITIDRPTYAGIQIQGPGQLAAMFERIAIANPGTNGVRIGPTVQGEATFSGVTVINPGSDSLLDQARPDLFTLTRGAGNGGW
ncbi:MAG: hypothetical protein H0T53_18215 [Herpetosiphonaceae bacterium]|nr:hypothetical protein [Herpetosiphonaceae bacterium]